MRILALLLISMLLFACDKVFLEEELANTPEQTFEALWQEFDEKYGLFQVKNIDWDSVYVVYRPQVNNGMSEAELYAVLTNMLDVLNDSHVALVPTTDSGLPMYQSGVLGRLDSINDFDLQTIKDHYLVSSRFEDPFFTYGILEGDIAYLHVEGFSDLPGFLDKPFETVMDSLAETKALIIDVRGGYGGEDLAGQYLAGWFATETILYMQTRIKSGPGPEDFTEFEEWDVQPEGSVQYTKPIMVLTHRWTVSARETFCLAMKVLPQVTFVGDTTTGAFSNQINRELPNGWGYSLSIGEWIDAEGVSYEGQGLPPNVLVRNKQTDVLAGKDETLERAMELLE